MAAVIDEWAGLGDNRRAVALHAAAVACVGRHGGALPSDLDGLLALAGVGPDTARAVLAFAHHADVGAGEDPAAGCNCPMSRLIRNGEWRQKRNVPARRRVTVALQFDGSRGRRVGASVRS